MEYKWKYIKGIIKDIGKKSPSVKTNLLRSMGRIKHDYLNIKEEPAYAETKGGDIL